MRYLYRICGIRVLCNMPFPVQIQRESEEFLREVNGTEKADIRFFLNPVPRLPIPLEGGHWESNRYYLDMGKEKQVYHFPARNYKPYARVIWRDNKKEIFCEYLQGKEYYMNYSHNLCDLLGLETLLLRGFGLLLHASFIRWKGKGILFSAPSGTGKSTQAKLWADCENAEILNGDRTGLRQTEDGWQAYGLPVAGSSEIYRNESAPLATVIVLRQGSENEIRKLSPPVAFRYLYPEVMIHSWEKDWVQKAAGLLDELVRTVPAYFLSCRAEQAAVELVKERIEKDNREGDGRYGNG